VGGRKGSNKRNRKVGIEEGKKEKLGEGMSPKVIC
jgi:hypothetical protein